MRNEHFNNLIEFLSFYRTKIISGIQRSLQWHSTDELRRSRINCFDADVILISNPEFIYFYLIFLLKN